MPLGLRFISEGFILARRGEGAVGRRLVQNGHAPVWGCLWGGTVLAVVRPAGATAQLLLGSVWSGQLRHQKPGWDQRKCVRFPGLDLGECLPPASAWISAPGTALSNPGHPSLHTLGGTCGLPGESHP